MLIGNGKRNLSEFVQGMVVGVLHPLEFLNEGKWIFLEVITEGVLIQFDSCGLHTNSLSVGNVGVMLNFNKQW